MGPGPQPILYGSLCSVDFTLLCRQNLGKNFWPPLGQIPGSTTVSTRGRAKTNSSKISSSQDWTQDLQIIILMLISEVSFVSCTTSHFGLWSFLEHKDSGWQLNVDLAQLIEHWHDDSEVMGSILTGAIFDEFFFALSCVMICQIIWQKRLSWKTRMCTVWKCAQITSRILYL